MLDTVSALLASGKGILAANESFPTIRKPFTALHIPSTEDNRRAHRELLFTAPGLGEFVSGPILFDKTNHQTAANGASMSEVLAPRSIQPGIKVDAGKAVVPGIVFLWRGQNDLVATQQLNAICRIGGAPRGLSCSFGRALQNEALKTWKGSPVKVLAADAALLHRARCSSLALKGRYSHHTESGALDQKAPA